MNPHAYLEELFSVYRADNGWIVVVKEKCHSPRYVLCHTWNDVKITCTNAAFFDPAEEKDPR